MTSLTLTEVAGRAPLGLVVGQRRDEVADDRRPLLPAPYPLPHLRAALWWGREAVFSAATNAKDDAHIRSNQHDPYPASPFFLLPALVPPPCLDSRLPLDYHIHLAMKLLTLALLCGVGSAISSLRANNSTELNADGRSYVDRERAGKELDAARNELAAAKQAEEMRSTSTRAAEEMPPADRVAYLAAARARVAAALSAADTVLAKLKSAYGWTRAYRELANARTYFDAQTSDGTRKKSKPTESEKWLPE